MPHTDPPLTRPLKIVAAWLKTVDGVTDLVDKRVSWKLTGTYPAIRLTDIGPMNRTAAGDQRRIQVECWAKDYDDAEQLAAAVAAALPSSRGDWPDGYCAGGDVVSGPRSAPDRESEKHRHVLDIGMWLYPSNPA